MWGFFKFKSKITNVDVQYIYMCIRLLTKPEVRADLPFIHGGK